MVQELADLAELCRLGKTLSNSYHVPDDEAAGARGVGANPSAMSIQPAMTIFSFTSEEHSFLLASLGTHSCGFQLTDAGPHSWNSPERERRPSVNYPIRRDFLEDFQGPR